MRWERAVVPAVAAVVALAGIGSVLAPNEEPGLVQAIELSGALDGPAPPAHPDGEDRDPGLAPNGPTDQTSGAANGAADAPDPVAENARTTGGQAADDDTAGSDNGTNDDDDADDDDAADD